MAFLCSHSFFANVYVCVCRSLVVSRRRRLKASSLSLMWQEYWQGHSDEEEIFIRNALAMGRLLTWDWLQHYHYPPEIQPIKVKTHAAYTLYFITVLVINCENVQFVLIETVLRDVQAGFLLPHHCAGAGAGRWERVALVTLVKYPLNDKNPISVLTFLISCLWLDSVH